MIDVRDQLTETAAAFDSVAATYDGPQGNNELIQRMRDITWARIESRILSQPMAMIDIGCGTGLDAAHFADLGHHVVATDWTQAMVDRCAARSEDRATRPDQSWAAGAVSSPDVYQASADRTSSGERAAVVPGSIRALRVGAQELDRLTPDYRGAFRVAYSNFGPLNCVPDLGRTARDLASLMQPDSRAIFTVIGRWCPWEVAHYVRKRHWRRVGVRFTRSTIPVGMNGQTIWTRYFTPREFARQWLAGSDSWELVGHEGLSTFVPPPYLTTLKSGRPVLFERLVRLDERTRSWPVLRSVGDHFLIEFRRR